MRTCAQALGVHLVHMTPSRGYGAELSAAVIIALASVYGLPVSTTQIIVSGCRLGCQCLCCHVWCPLCIFGTALIVRRAATALADGC